MLLKCQEVTNHLESQNHKITSVGKDLKDHQATIKQCLLPLSLLVLVKTAPLQCT